MGLGKTLQSICMMAGDQFLRNKKYEVSENLLLYVTRSTRLYFPLAVRVWRHSLVVACTAELIMNSMKLVILLHFI